MAIAWLSCLWISGSAWVKIHPHSLDKMAQAEKLFKIAKGFQ